MGRRYGYAPSSEPSTRERCRAHELKDALLNPHGKVISSRMPACAHDCLLVYVPCLRIASLETALQQIEDACNAPGDLAVVDNVRAILGRYGDR